MLFERVESEGLAHYSYIVGDRGEAVEVIYDPGVVSYEELLDLFWSIHDPTTRNRQGPDVGSQYRSAVFYHSPQQEAAARAKMEQLQRSGLYRGEMVTEIVSASEFYRAEEYHQRYFEEHGPRGCRLW
ncbi:peptide-methionine (S)-S-oxide reductase MsrA [Methanocrinis sp.]|uniref:peptide-methionine (S)-S-oxide reductase MsrA n=1 Tax=Methanocrinis sp. TaxID=3101522 RepID=UPI003D1293B4